MKQWMPALAAALVACSTAIALAAYHTEDIGASREEVLAPNSATPPQQVRLSIVQVFFPGVPDRFACRMQVRAVNESASRVNFRTLLKTFDEDKGALDSWLIPTGEIAPGQEVLRSYSCRPASSIEVSRVTEYGWPTTCQVNGQIASPCPIELHVTSSLAPPTPDPKKNGKKGE